MLYNQSPQESGTLIPKGPPVTLQLPELPAVIV